MSYKIPRISPSALAATERCPGFRPDGEDTQAATDGTMFHDEMRLMVETVPRSQWRNWIATRTDAGPQIMGLMEQAEAALRGAQYVPYYLYRQKYMSGGFENVGWAKGNTQNLYNICIMEELCTVLAMGGGASTKLTAPTGRIVRAFAPKYPQEYIERIADTCAEKAKIKEFYHGV